jgi:hypothetical protein
VTRPNYQQSDWLRLAEVLRTARVHQGFKIRSQLVAYLVREWKLKPSIDRILGDLERGSRDNYSDSTLTAVEVWYGMRTGDVNRILQDILQDLPSRPDRIEKLERVRRAKYRTAQVVLEESEWSLEGVEDMDAEQLVELGNLLANEMTRIHSVLAKRLGIPAGSPYGSPQAGAPDLGLVGSRATFASRMKVYNSAESRGIRRAMFREGVQPGTVLEMTGYEDDIMSKYSWTDDELRVLRVMAHAGIQGEAAQIDTLAAALSAGAKKANRVIKGIAKLLKREGYEPFFHRQPDSSWRMEPLGALHIGTEGNWLDETILGQGLGMELLGWDMDHLPEGEEDDDDD